MTDTGKNSDVSQGSTCIRITEMQSIFKTSVNRVGLITYRPGILLDYDYDYDYTQSLNTSRSKERFLSRLG